MSDFRQRFSTTLRCLSSSCASTSYSVIVSLRLKHAVLTPVLLTLLRCVSQTAAVFLFADSYECQRSIGFYRASICEGGLGSRNSVCPSVRLSVCLSVTRVDCDKTKWRPADIFIPHERAITLLLWYQEWLVGDAPFSLKSAFKVTHPSSKNTDFDRFFAHNVPTV